MADLLDQFVCVRVVQANGLDMTLFQFDYDLTWATMFLNADRTIYGRYGTRAGHDLNRDISLEGFKKALEAVLELHRSYPANKGSLAGKTGPAPQVRTPEEYPMLRKLYTPHVNPKEPDGAGSKVGPYSSCMHCHQINNNVYRSFRGVGQPIPDPSLWTYPMPNTLGLDLDIRERATVKTVAAGSSAEKDGFKPGDQILTINGQPIVSIADVQWVLHQSKREPAKLKAEVKRDDAPRSLTLSLPSGWRKKGDFSWRGCNEIVSPLPGDSQDLSADEKKNLGLSAKAIAIKVIWDANPFQRGDVVVEVDGRRDGMTASDLIAYTVQRKMPKDKVALTVLRAGKEFKIQVEAREAPLQ